MNNVKITAKDIFISFLILITATLINGVFHKYHIYEANIVLVYITAVLLIAYVTESKFPSLVSSVLAVLLFNFFFTEPYLSLKANAPGYPITFAIMFAVAFFASSITKKVEEISKIKNELVIKNKQEELRSTLLRAISHDLRTPLTGISGFADILIKNAGDLSDEKKLEIYTEIYDDSIRLLNLVENLLAITRFDKKEIVIKKESEFIYDVISDAISHLGHKKQNYDIKIDIEDERLSAKMDGGLMAQVIFNLADNAAKYSPEGTNIIVSAKAEGDDIKVSVADEGKGIDDKDKARIFEMFYTVNNTITDGRRGLGLGLALCKAILDAHGAVITVEDNKPSGTVFSFKIKGDFNE